MRTGDISNEEKELQRRDRGSVVFGASGGTGSTGPRLGMTKCARTQGDNVRESLTSTVTEFDLARRRERVINDWRKTDPFRGKGYGQRKQEGTLQSPYAEAATATVWADS